MHRVVMSGDSVRFKPYIVLVGSNGGRSFQFDILSIAHGIVLNIQHTWRESLDAHLCLGKQRVRVRRDGVHVSIQSGIGASIATSREMHTHPIVCRLKVHIALCAIQSFVLFISVGVVPIHLNISVIIVIHLQTGDVQTDF